jgi:hypothetical protein
MVPSVRFICLLAFAALLVIGCGDTSPTVGSISGKVVLEGGGGSLDGSFVSAGTAATVTSADGSYTLAGIAPGEVSVRVVHEGFVRQEQMLTVAAGQTASADFELSRRNAAPVLSALSATPAQLEPGATANLLASASDADGDTLTFEWSADNGFSVNPGEDGSATLTAPDAYGVSGTLSVTVGDGRGGEATAELQVSTRGNGAPVIGAISATPAAVQKGGTLALRAVAFDPDGDPLTFAWSAPDGWALTADGDSASVVAPSEPNQSAVLQLVVEDAAGETAQASVTVATHPNVPPVVASLTSTPSEAPLLGQLALSASASDEDGDPLSYSWSVDNADWTISGSGPTATASAPLAYDSAATVTLTVEDGLGGVTVDTLPVRTVSRCNPVTIQYAPQAHEYHYASSGSPVAQTFTVTQRFDLQSVVLPLAECVDNGANGARLLLTAVASGGAPDETMVVATFPDLASSELLDVCVGGVFQEATFTLATPVSLHAGTQYALVLEAVDEGSGSGGIYWRRSSTPEDPEDPYPYGRSFTFSGSWDYFDSLDLSFQVSGETCGPKLPSLRADRGPSL